MVIENNESMAQFSSDQFLELVVSAVQIYAPSAKPEEIRQTVIMDNRDFRNGLRKSYT